MSQASPPPADTGANLAYVVERNIRALVGRREQVERRRSFGDRVADAVTRFAGSMACVYLHLVLFGSWITINLPGVPLPKFDPSYVILAMFASVEAIFLSTFILISQNRMAALSEERAQLDLQISLLAEHEITRLITLVRAIAARLDIREAQDEELSELQKDVAPVQVLETMEKVERDRASQS